MPPPQLLTIRTQTSQGRSAPYELSVALSPEVRQVLTGQACEAAVEVLLTPFRNFSVFDRLAGPHAAITPPGNEVPSTRGVLTCTGATLHLTAWPEEDAPPLYSAAVRRDDVRAALEHAPPRPRPMTPAAWAALCREPAGVTVLFGGEAAVIPPPGDEWAGYDVTETHEDGAYLHVCGVTRQQAVAIARAVARHYVSSGIAERAGHACLTVDGPVGTTHLFRTGDFA